MAIEKKQAYGNRKANGDGRFLKWLKDNGHVPTTWGNKRTFQDDDIEKFWKNSRKDNDIGKSGISP